MLLILKNKHRKYISLRIYSKHYTLSILLQGLDKEDLMLLENSKVGIQMAARIVDTPCNEMNTDTFLNEVNFFFDINFGDLADNMFDCRTIRNQINFIFYRSVQLANT